MLGILYVQQIAQTDASINMFPNGITTVGKTFRMVCTVEGEEFVGWFDVNGNKVTARPTPGQLTRDKFYVTQSGNSYTLVIQKVRVADGGNYTCKGDQTERTFTLFVEFSVTEFPGDQDLYVGKSQLIQCSAVGYPEPTFEWYKDFLSVNFTDSRFTLLSNGTLLVSPVHERDVGEYTCRITQLGDFEGTSLREEQVVINVIVYGPPRIHYGESTNQTQLYSYVGNPSSVTMNCVWWGFPKPTLSIRKDNEQLPSKDVSTKTTKLLSYLQATVLTDDEEDFGTYTCHASNEFGSATHLVIINKAGPPSVPKNVLFLTTCDHLTVLWEPPDSDGGVPLSHYSVKLTDKGRWDDTVFVGVKTNRFTFTRREGVKPRTEYIVTVQAFNKFEEGEMAEGSVISAYCPPSGPFEITNAVTWLNSTRFTLEWTRPPSDGGDPNLRYDIEYSKETADGKYVHWNTRKNISTQEYNVTGLEGGAKYEIRVFVSNIAGRKREPARKEFNVHSGVSVMQGPESIGAALVYHMSVKCTSFYMQVDLALQSHNLDTETFRLENKSCGSNAVTSEHVSLRTPLNACGTIRRSNGDNVTYLNKVVAKTIGKGNIYIVQFPFSCTYRAHQTIGVPSFQPREKVTYFEEGYGNFSFKMGLYRTGEYTSPYEVFEYPVSVDPFAQLYCEAKLHTSDSGLVLFADTCVATPSMDPDHSVQYTFIKNGCPVDNGTQYDHTLTQIQRFQLYPFRWIPENFTLVYLHCNVIVCHKTGNSRCTMGCNTSNRRARSVRKKERHRVTLGPIIVRRTEKSTAENLHRDPIFQSTTTHSPGMASWTIVLSVFAALIVLALMSYGTIYLASFLTSSSCEVPVVPAKGNSEEMELFCTENV